MTKCYYVRCTGDGSNSYTGINEYVHLNKMYKTFIYVILNTFIIYVSFCVVYCHFSQKFKACGPNPTCRCASPVLIAKLGQPITGIMLRKPAVSSYACCFSFFTCIRYCIYNYTYIYIYITPINHILHHHVSLIKHTHTNHLCNHHQSPILPAIEHRDWPRRCERHLNDLKFETLEIGGKRISWITSIALTSWVTSVNFWMIRNT